MAVRYSTLPTPISFYLFTGIRSLKRFWTVPLTGNCCPFSHLQTLFPESLSAPMIG